MSFVVGCLLVAACFSGLLAFAVCGLLRSAHWRSVTPARCSLPVVCCVYVFVLLLLVVCRGVWFAMLNLLIGVRC